MVLERASNFVVLEQSWGNFWAKHQILSDYSDLSSIAQAFQYFSFYDLKGQNISEMT